MKKLLIVVDYQKDFVDGALGFAKAATLDEGICAKISAYRQAGDAVAFTYDTHQANYMDTQEGKYLPVIHCVKDTDGWALIPELEKIRVEKDCKCYDKPTFGSTALAADIKSSYEAGEIETVELIGICTDICVVSNALLIKAYCPELPISLDSACCAGVTPEKHEAALETMRSCQIQVK